MVVKSRGVSWGVWGPRPPGVTQGAPKEEKRERERRERKEKQKRKEGTKKRKDRNVNQFNDRGVIQGRIESGRRRRPLYFSEKGRLTLCGSLRQKMNQIVRIDFESFFFSTSEGAHPLRHPLFPQAQTFYWSLNLPPPLFFSNS